MTLRKLTSQINFAGGIDKSGTKYDIKDVRSPDMSNMVCDLNGACFKRSGTSRFNAQVITQAAAINGLFRGYKSDGTKMMLIDSGTVLYKATDAGVLTAIKSSLTAGAMNFCVMNDLVICTNYSNAPFSFNFNATCTDLSGTPPQGRYCVVHKNYLIMGNCYYSAAAYSSRIWFSALADPDVWGANNYINIRTSDGAVITGLASIHGILYVFKTNSIHSVAGDVFDDDPAISDIDVSCISDGIGCIAPKTLVTIGGDTCFYLAQDGVRIFNGSSSQIISQNIAPILNDIPAANRANCAAGYDAKNKWYWLSIEDPLKYPDGKLNTILIYDTNNGEWYRIDDISANIFCCWDGSADSNQFYYGDSYEGFVNKLNDSDYGDDVPLEKPIASMEATETWSDDGAADTSNYKEGVRGIKLTHSAATGAKTTSVTVALDLNKFLNNIASSTSDYIQFKIYHTDRSEIGTLALVFTDGTILYTFSGNAAAWGLTAGDNQWTTVNIVKSDFTISGGTPSVAWKGITTVTLTHTLAAPSTIVLTFDDMRLVKSTRTPIKAYRYTKVFDLKRPEIKKHFNDLRAIIGNTDADCYVTCLMNGGMRSKVLSAGRTISEDYIYSIENATTTTLKKIDKSTLISDSTFNTGVSLLFLCRDENNLFCHSSASAGTLYKLSARTYSLQSYITSANAITFGYLRAMTIDDKYVYLHAIIGTAGANRVVILNKHDLSYVNTLIVQGTSYVDGMAVDSDYLYVMIGDVLYKYNKITLELITSIGSNGSGNDQFDNASDNNSISFNCICVDKKYLYVTDLNNARIQKRLKDDLSYVSSVASAKTLLSGVCCDNTYLYVKDEGDDDISRYLKSTMTLIDDSANSFIVSHAIIHSIKYWLGDMTIDVPFPIKDMVNDIQFKFENNNEGEDLKLYKMSISYIPGTLK